MLKPSGIIGTISLSCDGEELSSLDIQGVVASVTRTGAKGVFAVGFDAPIEHYVALPTASQSSDYSASIHARVPSNGKTTEGFQLEVLDESGEFIDPKLAEVAIMRVAQ